MLEDLNKESIYGPYVEDSIFPIPLGMAFFGYFTYPGWDRMFILRPWIHDFFQILWSFHGRISCHGSRDASMNLPHSIRKKESNSTIIWGIVKKMWLFFHPESAILPLERLLGGWASSSRRIAACGWGKRHNFSTNSQIIVEFDSFRGVESGEFMDASRVIHGTKYVHATTIKFEKRHGFMDVK